MTLPEAVFAMTMTMTMTFMVTVTVTVTATVTVTVTVRLARHGRGNAAGFESYRTGTIAGIDVPLPPSDAF